MGVTQKSWFRRNRFCRVTPAQFIRYLKSFYKAILDINKPLALYVRIFSAKDTLKFLRITYARTHQEVSHKTKLIGLCLLLRLWILIWTLLKFRTFRSISTIILYIKILSKQNFFKKMTWLKYLIKSNRLLSRQEREESTYYRYIKEVNKQCTYYRHYKERYMWMFIFITNTLHICNSIRRCSKPKTYMACR